MPRRGPHPPAPVPYYSRATGRPFIARTAYAQGGTMALTLLQRMRYLIRPRHDHRELKRM